MSETVSDPVAPAAFDRALKAVRTAKARPELELHDFPAPTGLAPHAVALAADVLPVRHGIDSVLGTGRFVLLYDPEEPEAWGGPFRVVCFTQAPLENDIGVDPFLADVAWSWLLDSLEVRRAGYSAISGTATKVLSTGFGELADQGDGAQIELRASWTPNASAIGASVEAWGDLLCRLAGLPPASEVAGLLTHRRRARG